LNFFQGRFDLMTNFSLEYLKEDSVISCFGDCNNEISQPLKSQILIFFFFSGNVSGFSLPPFLLSLFLFFFPFVYCLFPLSFFLCFSFSFLWFICQIIIKSVFLNVFFPLPLFLNNFDIFRLFSYDF